MSNSSNNGAATGFFSLSLETMGFITWLVFLVLKLAGITTMSWFWVWFPLWIPIAAVIGIILLLFIIGLIVGVIRALIKKDE